MLFSYLEYSELFCECIKVYSTILSTLKRCRNLSKSFFFLFTFSKVRTFLNRILFFQSIFEWKANLPSFLFSTFLLSFSLFSPFLILFSYFFFIHFESTFNILSLVLQLCFPHFLSSFFSSSNPSPILHPSYSFT